MSLPLSHIIVTTHRDPLYGTRSFTYEWQGDTPYTEIDEVGMSWVSEGYVVIKEGEIFNVGPYRLYPIEFEYWSHRWLCVRWDTRGRLRVTVYRATRGLSHFYRCLLLTAIVWGLGARPSEGDRLTWRTIRKARNK